MLIQNAIQTPDGTILISLSVHDYKSHQDKVTNTYYSIDGGLEYRRISTGGPYLDLSIESGDKFEDIRKSLLRVSRGKNLDQPAKWVKLKDMSNAWLEALIIWIEENQPENFFKPFYLKEIEYRAENNIYVED